MVTHMAILQKLYNAVKSCKDGNVDEGITNLDIAAAYYTGSFEGTEDGGSFDGSLNFFLARRMCIYFDTCSQSNNALINERMISLFYSAQGELDTKVSRTKYDIWVINILQHCFSMIDVPCTTGMCSSRENSQTD